MTVSDALAQNGFAVIPSVITREAVVVLAEALRGLEGRQPEKTPGVRGLLQASQAVRELARSPEIRALVTPTLGESAFAVRGILFDKTPDANWLVPWHQDLTIAVRERSDVPGFGPWSVKAGIVHVQPPAALLERMLTVRLHLDDCTEASGPLRVLPGSHRHGRLGVSEIAQWREAVTEVSCPVPSGGALLMRPLLLHASSPATLPEHRRIIHLEFAAELLSNGLAWQEAVGQ